MEKKNNKTTELIISYGTEIIDNRFQVKVSTLDTGTVKATFLVVTQDLLEGGFSMKYFDDKESVAIFLKLLRLVK